MNSKDDRPDDAAALRRQAEDIATREKVTSSPDAREALSPDEALRMLHELRIHQIELEMQNEELRRAQEELEEARARYFDLYDLAPVGYFSISEKGLILEVNLTAANLLNTTRDTLVGQPLSRFILPEDQDIYYRHRKQLLETGKAQVCELRIARKDGTQFWVGFETTIARNGDGHLQCRTVMIEITERKRVETDKAALEAQNRQLQKAESLRCMAGAIAHHFNNQLSVVIGNLELAMIMLSQGTRPLENIRDATNASHRAAEMSGLMLTYLGQTFQKREPLNLSEPCRQTLRMLLKTMPKHVRVVTDLPSSGPVITSNAGEIKQLLTNLLTNAWEAVGEGQGSIHLALKMVSPTQMQIPMAHRFPIGWQPQDHAYVCLEVADTGSGIAESDIEKIFDPFFSSKFTGRGLGGAVILGIVRTHNGGVTVESEPGRGSTFRVFFPAPDEKFPRKLLNVDTKPPETSGGRKGKAARTVLLVEDEEMLRIVAARMIARLGYTVLKASDGLEAVDVFQKRQNQIRCVLCDLTMPLMDGWETLTALRKIAPDIPVILTSGYNETQVMAGKHPEQPQAFLSKPYTLNQLDAAIQHATRQEITDTNPSL